MTLHVTGAGGMLGRMVVEEAKKAGADVITYTHAQWDIADPLATRDHTDQAIFRGDVIINCAGIPISHGQSLTMDLARRAVAANAVGPRVLALEAAQWKASVIHVSTDCVFSGRKYGLMKEGLLDERAEPDPIDLYGRSKLLGEVDAPHVLNVRGSFIGWDGGMLAWLRQQRGDIQGWNQAHWTGLYVRAYARVLVALVPFALDGLNGVLHVPGPQRTKHDVLSVIAGVCDLPVRVVPVETPVVHRALSSVRWGGLGIPLPDWIEMLSEVRDDFERGV